MQTLERPLDAYDLVSDPELRRAAAKTLKGFCATYLAHHFPQPPSDFFDEMANALQNHDIKRLEVIGFRGCAKSTMASLALVLWAALEHPDRYRSSSCSRIPADKPASTPRACSTSFATMTSSSKITATSNTAK
jgi:hypothetical protein